VNDLSSVSVLLAPVGSETPEIELQPTLPWDLMLPIMAIASVMVLVLAGISVLLVTV
jgi:hypothetical protein